MLATTLVGDTVTLPAPDPEALRSHVAFVRAVARAALAGDAEVEDVVQETWLAALQGGPRDRGLLRAWLAGVTRRQAALLIRRRTRERRRLGALARAQRSRVAEPDSAAEALARAETGQRLIESVLTLPEIYSTVLLLRYQDDLPPREIARRLDVPVETVRTRVRRGLEHLRERLEAADRARGADWRASLLLLLPKPSTGVSTISGTLLGAVLVKKWILVAVAAVALLLGGALLTLEFPSWYAAPVASPREGPAAQGGAPRAAEIEEAGARLRGSVVQPGGPAHGAPSAVDLASVDRDRDLHWTLLDADTGAPVVGADIVLVARTWARTTTFDPVRSAEERVRAATTTAADGTWRIRLERGDVADLNVRAVGYAARLVRAVQAGERVDLRLERGTSLLVRVLDARGRVRPGANVRIFQTHHATADGYGFAAQHAVTDEAGCCTLRGLPPGVAVMLDVSHPTDGAAMWREARAPASGVEEIVITLPPGRTLTGKVTDARTGAPISGAQVGIGWTLDAPVVTDEAGDYELPGWTAQGVYEIAVHAGGYAQDEALVGARTRIDFALTPDDRIRGRVLDGVGHPVPGVRIAAVGSSRETGRQVTSGGTAESGAEGRFEIRGLRHDMPHRLILYARGHGRTLRDVEPPIDAGGVRDVGDIRLAPAGVIAGIVRRAEGTPLSRIAVQLAVDRVPGAGLVDGVLTLGHDYGLEEERYTDDLGRFLFPDVAPGDYTVTVRLHGGSSVERRVELPAEAPYTDLVLTVHEGRPFTVRVEDTTGEPVDQAAVFVATADGERLTGTTNASGVAAFELLAEPVSVSVDTVFELSRKRYIEPAEAEIPPGRAEIRVVLTPADVIRGRVVDERDRPLARVTLRAVRDGDPVASGWTRQDGTFQLTVPVGAQVDVELEGTRLEETASGFISHEAFVEGAVRRVHAGDSGVVVRAHTVARTGSVTIRVTDPSGTPLADAVVFASRPEGEGITTARTGAEGEAVLLALPVAELEFAAGRAPRARGEAWVTPSRVRATPSGQVLTLPYRRGARVEGIVVDGGGEPAVGERVEAAYGEGAYQATTDAAGRFSTLVPTTAMEVRVRLLRPTASGALHPAVTTRPGDLSVRLRLE